MSKTRQNQTGSDRINQMLARGTVKSVRDENGMQMITAELLHDEEVEAENFQLTGFSGVPLEGAEVLIGFLGGNRSNPIVIAVGDRTYRLQVLDDGGVAMFDHRGNKVVLNEQGTTVESPTEIVIQSPEIIFEGNLRLSGRGSSKRIHRVGDTDSDGDAAVNGAPTVFA